MWKGDFSAAILKHAEPKTLYLIDPWLLRDDAFHHGSWYGQKNSPDMDAVCEGVRQRFREECEAGVVVIKRALSQDALKAFPDEHFDFIYIDGDHEYSAVKEDCLLAFDKVRRGGLICGDDYTLGGWWKDGVVRAFHELIHERPVIVHYAGGTQIVLRKLRQRRPVGAGREGARTADV